MFTMTDAELIEQAENRLPHISIADACAKYGIERKLLIGRLMRNAFEDPITASGDANRLDTIKIADDCRLWALSPSHKS